MSAPWWLLPAAVALALVFVGLQDRIAGSHGAAAPIARPAEW